jgi:hypothetical protein
VLVSERRTYDGVAAYAVRCIRKSNSIRSPINSVDENVIDLGVLETVSTFAQTNTNFPAFQKIEYG